MLSTNNINNLPGLNISTFKNNDLNLMSILPLIAEEFPSWGLDRLKSYIKLVIKQESNGILIAKNSSLYNVGLLIYSMQDIINKGFSKNTKKGSNMKHYFVDDVYHSSRRGEPQCE